MTTRVMRPVACSLSLYNLTHSLNYIHHDERFVESFITWCDRFRDVLIVHSLYTTIFTYPSQAPSPCYLRTVDVCGPVISKVPSIHHPQRLYSNGDMLLLPSSSIAIQHPTRLRTRPHRGYTRIQVKTVSEELSTHCRRKQILIKG